MVLKPWVSIRASDWYWSLILVLEPLVGIGASVGIEASDWYWSLRLVLEPSVDIGCNTDFVMYTYYAHLDITYY